MDWLNKIDEAFDRGTSPEQQETQPTENQPNVARITTQNPNRTTEDLGESSVSEGADHDTTRNYPLHEGLVRLTANVSEFCSLPHLQNTRHSSGISSTPSDNFDAFVSENNERNTGTDEPLEPENSLLNGTSHSSSPSVKKETDRQEPMVTTSTVADLQVPTLDSETSLANRIVPQIEPTLTLNLSTNNIDSEKVDEQSSSNRRERNVSDFEDKGSGPVSESVENGPLPDHIHIEMGLHSSIDQSTDIDANKSEDFRVKYPITPWDPDSSMPFDRSQNCQGVVHVRILSAQKLPCPAGSMVQAIVALPPWKGRVRTEPANAFLGPRKSGVCVKWDQLSDAGCCSMVHAWNSEDTPIPTLTVDLMFQPLNLMEFVMCSLRLSCEPLMRSPGTWKKQWCKSFDSKSSFLDSLILLEAAFVPDDFDDFSVTSQEGAEGTAEACDEPLTPPMSPLHPSSVSRTVRTSRSIGSAPSFMLTAKTPKKLHLLRLQSFWVPATCAVCSAVIVGWNRGFRCEACSIDCCKDCQLQIDLQLPCGSSLAKDAVESSIQAKMNVGSFLNVVAPDNSIAGPSKMAAVNGREDKVASTGFRKLDSVMKEKRGAIGILRLQIIRACALENPFPPETDPSTIDARVEDDNIRRGDFYVRVTSFKGSKDGKRTATVQNSGRPTFESDEMFFDVTHYGMEYRLELIDATTDKPVGTTLLTAQSLLQQQRDMLVEAGGFPLVSPFRLPEPCTEKRKMKLELRRGVKSGFGNDFFVASKQKESAKKPEETSRPGEISGWIELDLCLEEDTDLLYGSGAPLECPERPPDDLNVEMFQLHLARIGALVDDIKSAVSLYTYVISWKSPALTSLSLIIFVTFSLRFNTEYFGILPVFFLILTMLYLALIRSRGRLKDRFISREKATRIKAEKAESVDYNIHRPIGRFQISVHKARSLRSRDLGLPGSVGCRIYWDPLRYSPSPKQKEKLIAIDKSLKSTHDVGETSFKYSSNPIWDAIEESRESKHLKQLLPTEGLFFESQLTDSKVNSQKAPPVPVLEFPVLQPIKIDNRRRPHGDGGSGPQKQHSNVQLDSWENSVGGVVVEVRFQDVLNKLPGFDDVLGEVSFPLSKLIEIGSIEGWFQVCESGSTRLLPARNMDGNHAPTSDIEKVADPAQIFVALKWEPPRNEKSNEMDREASAVIAEELIRTAARAQGKLDLVGASVGAFNTVRELRGYVQLVQNMLGSILDSAERIRNAFNFTDPFKSSVVLAALTLVWVFLALVPTRVIVLAAGLGQYAATFMAAFGPGAGKPKETQPIETEVKGETKDNKESPVVIWLLNAFRGLPTDEDLRKAYFWESRRLGERETQKLLSHKRSARLERLWKAQWYAFVEIKSPNVRTGASANSRDWHWRTVFAMIQGHRFLWWSTVQDFDGGEAPIGRIFLAGHAGLAGLSPLDLRELKSDEISLAVSIFGRGIEGQQKITLLLPDAQAKETLESKIFDASTKED